MSVFLSHFQSAIFKVWMMINRAARCTENIGASRFRRSGSGFDSRIPDFGSVRTLHCAFNITMFGGWKIIFLLRLAIVNDLLC